MDTALGIRQSTDTPNIERGTPVPFHPRGHEIGVTTHPHISPPAIDIDHTLAIPVTEILTLPRALIHTDPLTTMIGYPVGGNPCHRQMHQATAAEIAPPLQLNPAPGILIKSASGWPALAGQSGQSHRGHPQFPPPPVCLMVNRKGMADPRLSSEPSRPVIALEPRVHLTLTSQPWANPNLALLPDLQ